MTIRYFAGGAKRWAAATLVLCAAMAANAQFLPTGEIHSPTQAEPAKIAKGTPSISVKVSYNATQTGTVGPCVLKFIVNGVTAEFTNQTAFALNADFDVPTGDLSAGSHDILLTVRPWGSFMDLPVDFEIEAIQVYEQQDSNQPPTVELLEPEIDLGAVVGCLGYGDFGALGKQFATSFRLDGTTVKLTVSEATQTVAEFDVAKISDLEGDEVSVALNNPTTGLTFTGPGVDAKVLNVEIVATDANASTVENWSGNAKAQIVYGSLIFGSPVTKTKSHKMKAMLPVKFTLEDGCGTFVTDANLPGPTPRISVTNAEGDFLVGSELHYDPASGQWVCFVKPSSFGSPGTFTLSVDLGDGTFRSIDVTIRQ